MYQLTTKCFFSVLLGKSRATDLQALSRQSHLHKACVRVGWCVCQCLTNAYGRFRIFRHDVEIASASRPRQFIAQGIRMDLADNLLDSGRIRTCVEGFILCPCLPDQLSVSLKITPLDRLEEIQRMSLHLAQQLQVRAAVEEHAAHDLCQDTFGGAGNAGVVEQMAGPIGRVGEEILWQPTYDRTLIESFTGLQQLQAMQYASILVLPTATGGEQLLQDQRAIANLVLIPRQTAEVSDGT